jgi:hypothetical protein
VRRSFAALDVALVNLPGLPFLAHEVQRMPGFHADGLLSNGRPQSGHSCNS